MLHTTVEELVPAFGAWFTTTVTVAESFAHGAVPGTT